MSGESASSGDGAKTHGKSLKFYVFLEPLPNPDASIRLRVSDFSSQEMPTRRDIALTFILNLHLFHRLGGTSLLELNTHKLIVGIGKKEHPVYHIYQKLHKLNYSGQSDKG